MVDRKGPSRARQVEGAGQKVAYLGRRLCFQGVEDRGVEHRIGRGWARFAVFKGEFCDHQYSSLYRLRPFDAVFSSMLLYGAGAWTMALARERRL